MNAPTWRRNSIFFANSPPALQGIVHAIAYAEDSLRLKRSGQLLWKDFNKALA